MSLEARVGVVQVRRQLKQRDRHRHLNVILLFKGTYICYNNPVTLTHTHTPQNRGTERRKTEEAGEQELLGGLEAAESDEACRARWEVG